MGITENDGLSCNQDNNKCTRTSPGAAESNASSVWRALAPFPVYTKGTGNTVQQKMVQYMYGLPGTPNNITNDKIVLKTTNNEILVTTITNPSQNNAEAKRVTMSIPAGQYTAEELQEAVNKEFKNANLNLTMTHFCAKDSWNSARQMCKAKIPAPAPAPAPTPAPTPTPTPTPTPGPSVLTTQGVISYTPMFVYTGPADTNIQKIIIHGNCRAPLGRKSRFTGISSSAALLASMTADSPCPENNLSACEAKRRSWRLIQAAEQDSTALSIYTQIDNDAFKMAQSTYTDLESVVVANQVNAPYPSITEGFGRCRSTSTADLTGLSSLRNQQPSAVTCNVFSSPIHPEDPGTKSTWETADSPQTYTPGDFIQLYFTKGTNYPPSSYNPKASVPVTEGDSTLVILGIVLGSLGLLLLLSSIKAGTSAPGAAQQGHQERQLEHRETRHTDL